ncbi:hypothetical protein AABB24_012288 [Solanum stoloniferum]|uniref:Histone acetyltransferase n=3 Tax=Solanum TaxID=4107 RepID=A0AAF0U0K3_SOLVR|nr:uncharacterized protein LOC125824410 isoform X1 [Solanum verrucosum]WMV36685.1 hypothetical protein MTR67_030070 [Solanum verrucosum]
MPRPGPRPYECVRRAWHSDRHQPMRGSIIQQIFRVVRERHSVVTKKNREWQQKLPVVVLKAEEIMYSKANSEAEYMDPETLWDRVNDAIDTIIRRDETETGQLLPPCVEAALNLGCIPERASRSQRNSNPRSYLSPRTEEPHCVPPKVFSRSANELNSNSSLPIRSGNQPLFLRPSNVNTSRLASEFDRPVMPCINNLGASSSAKAIIIPESSSSLDVGSVYPLFYGNDLRPEVSTLVLREPQHNVIVGKPIYPSIVEPAKISCFPRLFPSRRDDLQEKSCQADFRDKTRRVPELDCDLSLRLGLSANSDLQLQQGQTSCIGDFRPSGNSHEGDQFKLMSTSKGKEFTFFPAESANSPSGLPSRLHRAHGNLEGYGHNTETLFRKHKMPVRPSDGFQERYDVEAVSTSKDKEYPFFLAESANSPSGLQTGRVNLEGEDQNAATLLRKRKMPIHNNMELGQFLWQDEQTLNRFPGQMKRPGS